MTQERYSVLEGSVLVKNVVLVYLWQHILIGNTVESVDSPMYIRKKINKVLIIAKIHYALFFLWLRLELLVLNALSFETFTGGMIYHVTSLYYVWKVLHKLFHFIYSNKNNNWESMKCA